MRLSLKNILLVNQFDRENGNTDYHVIMKGNRVADVKHYHSITELPATVINFLHNAKCELVYTSEQFGFNQYQYTI